ncbi:MAG: hypothetical protein HYT90_04050 [Candidatus Omnitrophica bacterium]|nr:hypothetical protein [Candidatus Omnitrophota bacterium]
MVPGQSFQGIRLRAGAVRLKPGGAMEWHSTRSREELLVLLAGQVGLETEGSRHRPSTRVARSGRPRARALRPRPGPASRGRVRRVALRAGQCAWIPPRTVHRVVNRSAASAWYLYVTA